MAAGQHPYNLLRNGSFESWSNGTDQAPDYWTKSGTIARDGSYKKFGNYGVKLTGSQASIDHTAMSPNPVLGRTATFGCWVKASSANRVRIYIFTDPVTYYYSSYHTGGGGWEFLTITHAIVASTFVGCKIEAGAQIDAYFDGAILVDGNEAWEFAPNPLDDGGEVYGDLTFKGGKKTKGLPVPSAIGEAIRQTSKITESALENVIDGVSGGSGKVSEMIDCTWEGDNNNNRVIDLGDDYDLVFVFIQEPKLHTDWHVHMAYAFKSGDAKCYGITYNAGASEANHRAMTSANALWQGKMTGDDANKVKLGSAGNHAAGTNYLNWTYRLIGFKFSSME